MGDTPFTQDQINLLRESGELYRIFKANLRFKFPTLEEMRNHLNHILNTYEDKLNLFGPVSTLPSPRPRKALPPHDSERLTKLCLP